MAIGAERAAVHSLLPQTTERIQPIQRSSLRTYLSLATRGGADRPVAARGNVTQPAIPASIYQLYRYVVQQGPENAVRAAAAVAARQSGGSTTGGPLG